MKRASFFTLISLTLALFLFVHPVSAKDEWIQIKSKNFLLIGNATEKDIRKVGTRLEEFRETFRLLFPKMSVTSQVPINVIVFKNASSYKQFKPLLADGKIDTSIAGYFQSGDDVNYITLSTEGEDAQTFGVIFHEYVHSLVNLQFGKAEVPPWFNEGLAEYYETFTIENDSKVKVGLPQERHLYLLQKNVLMPLQTLFSVTNTQLSNSSDQSRNIFYAESWALIHYLIQSGKSDAMNKFVELLLSESPLEKAFPEAFQTSYAAMETELRRYISLNKYSYREFIFGRKLEFDSGMRVSPLDEAGINSYLGDLLAHTHREDEAEPYLLAALKLQPSSGMANTSLGMIKMRQGKHDEAKKYLEKAFTSDQTNYRLLYDYAYLLSREGRDDLGFVRELPKETTVKMRDALNKAIALNPAFTESYELLAFIDLVNGEDLDGATALMQKALKMQPGNQNYAMRLAEIYLRQNKYAEAGVIVDKIAKTTDAPDLRQRAENLGLIVRERREMEERRAAERKQNPGATGHETYVYPSARDTPTEAPMTEAEVERAKSETKMRDINQLIRQIKPGEQRVVGHLQKIECRGRQVAFLIKTATNTTTLVSRDFQDLELKVFVEATSKVEIGCDANLAALNALITYKPTPGNGSGELVAVEFVPTDFRLMKTDELKQPPPRIVAIESVDANGVALSTPPNSKSPDADKSRGDSITQSIKNALPKPAAGEKREIGYLDRIECSDKDVYFIVRTAGQTLRLYDAGPKPLTIRLFVPELEGTVFDCTSKPAEFPAVFVYRPGPDAKSKTAGVILSLDFVPKTFVLD